MDESIIFDEYLVDYQNAIGGAQPWNVNSGYTVSLTLLDVVKQKGIPDGYGFESRQYEDANFTYAAENSLSVDSASDFVASVFGRASFVSSSINHEIIGDDELISQGNFRTDEQFQNELNVVYDQPYKITQDVNYETSLLYGGEQLNPVVSSMGQDMYIIYERPLRLNDVKAYIHSITGNTMRVEVHNNTPRHLMNVKLRPVYFDGRAHSEYIVVPGAVDPYTDYVFDVPVNDSNLSYQLAYLMAELPNPVYDTEIETVVSVTNAGRLAGGSIEGVAIRLSPCQPTCKKA